MRARTIDTIWVTRVFVLIYVLLGFSTANASFWCQGSATSSHLESNPIGECWNVCNVGNDEHSEETINEGIVLSAEASDCFDTPVHFSVITPSNRTSPLSKIATTDIDPITLPFNPAKSSMAVHLAKLAIPAQLPISQSLMALRTTILLH